MRSLSPLRALPLVLASLVLAIPLAAQRPADRRSLAAPVAPRQDGPRFGLTLLGRGLEAELSARGYDVGNQYVELGWQFERRFGRAPITPVASLLLLAGGLDRGVLLPSATGQVSLRTPSGFGLGIGPTVGVTGAGLAAALTISPPGRPEWVSTASLFTSPDGARLSLLVGFAWPLV